jgi:hypothetical protein
MRGTQRPGGGRPHDRTRRMYAVRRVLAILILLLLLALIIPRACQALIGSQEGAGPGEDRGATAPEKAAGAGGADGGEGTTAEKKADVTDEDAAKKKGEGEARKGKVAAGQDGEKDLGAILTETLVERSAPPEGTGQDAAVGDGADRTAQLLVGFDAGDEQQLPPQDATGPAPADQPAPVGRQSPGLSNTAAPAEKPPHEPAPKPRARSERGPVASASWRVSKPAPEPIEQPAVRSASVSGPNLDRVQISAPEPGPVGAATVRVTPVAATPVQPAPVVNDTAFVGGSSVAVNTGGAATNFGGAPVNSIGAVRGAVAVAGAVP